MVVEEKKNILAASIFAKSGEEQRETASLKSRAFAWLYSVPKNRTEGDGRSLDRIARRVAM